MPASLDKLEPLYTGPEEAVSALPRPMRGQLSEILKDSTDRDMDVMRMVNRAFLSDRLGVPVQEVTDQHMHTYAQEKFGVQVSNDRDFYASVGARVKQAKAEQDALNEANTQLFEAFRTGMDRDQALSQAMVLMNESNGFVADHTDGYREFQRSTWDKFTAVADKHADTIGLVSDYMEKARDGFGDTEKAAASHQSVMDALKGLPQNERLMVMDIASGALQAEGEEGDKQTGFLGKVLGRVSRGSERFLASAMEGTLQAGRPGVLAPPTALEDEMAIDRELSARISGEVQPLESASYLGEGFLDFAESLPRVLAMANPAGVGINVLATKSDLKAGYVGRGLSDQEAEALSTFAAPIHAAGDFVESRMLLGKIPGLARLTTAITNPVARAVNIAGISFGTELAIESAQELVSPTVQALAGVLSEDIPDVNWEEELGSLADQTPETIAALLPMVLIGTGASMFSHDAYGLEMMKRRDYLEALGFNPDTAQVIAQADRPLQAASVMRKEWDKREPESETAKTARAELAQELQPPMSPESVQKKPDGGFIVKDPEGNPVAETQTPEEAARIVSEMPARPPEDTTALNKAEIELLREQFGFSELPAPQRERFAQVLGAAKQKGLSNSAESLATEIVANPRLISAEEHASMVLRSAQLQNEFERLQNQAAVEADMGNLERANELEQRSDNILKQLDILTEASDKTGTEIGRALSIRRMRVNRRTYTLANIVQRARVAKKGQLTPEQNEQFRQLSEAIAEQNARIDRLEEELAKERVRADEAASQTFVEEGTARRSAARRQTAAARRQGYKKQLIALGYRLNDITNVVPMSAEAATLVSKIAETYIEEGVSTLQELKAKIQNEIPDLSDQDIFNALGGRIKAHRKRIENEAQKRIRELKQQARLMAKINDALEGKFDKGPVRKDSDEVKALRKQLGKLRMQADRAAQEDASLRRIHEKINEIQDQLEGGFRIIGEKKERRPDTVDKAALKTKLRELQRLMRTQDAISDLEEQIRTGNFKVSAPEQRVIESAELQDALIKRKQLQRQVNNAIERMRKKTPLEKGTEGILLLRSLRATADMSAFLRQGLILSVRRPATALKAFSQAAKAFFGQNTADAIDLAIRRHPNQATRDRAGLFLSELDVGVNQREEAFAGDLAERIPGLGKVVRASNRNMTTFLNLIRSAAFDQFLAAHPEATLEQQTAFAQYVNVASGRGDLGRFNNATRTLSVVFFAPKFAVSRFQVLYSPFRNFNDKTVRNEIAKDFLALGMTGMTVLLLAAASGAEVGVDPGDSDFGKIVIGDTRIDIWGGLQQPMRLMLQPILAGMERAGLYESERDIDLIDAGRRYMSYKLSPAVTVPAELATGQDIVGNETSVAETLATSVIPLALEDTFEVWENSESEAKAAAAFSLAFVGVGVSEHGPRTEKQRAARERQRERDARE